MYIDHAISDKGCVINDTRSYTIAVADGLTGPVLAKPTFEQNNYIHNYIMAEKKNSLLIIVDYSESVMTVPPFSGDQRLIYKF